MSQTAAHLVDHVISHVPVRQWVLSLPIPLRVLLAAQPELITPVRQVVQGVVTRHLLGQAGLATDEGHSGAVTLIQPFGSAANLNIHLHCLVLDGVYPCGADSAPDFVEAGTLRPLQAAAVAYRIVFGPRAGHKVLTVRGAMPHETTARQPLCADVDGFSLHAAARVEAHDRKRLEQLCRYITRLALSDERVQLNTAGQVELKLKTPWRDGTTHLVMSPLEFMQRLAALVRGRGRFGRAEFLRRDDGARAMGGRSAAASLSSKPRTWTSACAMRPLCRSAVCRRPRCWHLRAWRRAWPCGCNPWWPRCGPAARAGSCSFCPLGSAGRATTRWSTPRR
jgi:hypothetical protein